MLALNSMATYAVDIKGEHRNMKNPIEQVGELSAMKRELLPGVLQELRGESGSYADRLRKVADTTYLRNTALNGTTISRPTVLRHVRNNRLQQEVMPAGFGMFVREIPTPQGYLVMFPLHTVALSMNGTPIIDPSILGESYTIVHIPKNSSQRTNTMNPAEMRADLAFTVDKDNLVTVNGMNPVTAIEYALFDEIVCEFERRAGEQ